MILKRPRRSSRTRSGAERGAGGRTRARSAVGRAADRLLDDLPEIVAGGGLDGLPDAEPPDLPQDEGDDAGASPGPRRPVPHRRGQAPEVRVIEPRQPGVLERLREFWRYRWLVGYFGRQMVEKLYRRTWLGWVWIPLRPVLSIGTRVFVFGGLLGVPSGGVPYLLFFLVGLAAWQLFAYTLFWATRSLEMGRRVLRRMYVPRLTCLVGSTVPSIVNFALYLAIAALVLAYYRVADGTFYVDPGPQTLATVAGLVLGLALGLAIGSWTSVFGAQARDVRFIIGYALGLWFFVTPIIYPLNEVPEGVELVVNLNPMTAPIELVRYGLFESGQLPTVTAMCSTLGSLIAVGGSGLWFFNRSEAAALDSL